jgi:hypothetical protein
MVFPPRYRFMKLLVLLLGMLVLAPLSGELFQVRALGDFIFSAVGQELHFLMSGGK